MPNPTWARRHLLEPAPDMQHSRKNSPSFRLFIRSLRALPLLALPLLAGVVLAGGAGFAGGAETGAATTTTTTVTAGQYSAPVWFPLRRSVTGAEIKIGCTYLSYGTEGGYECGGHHPFWALDLLAASGTSIYPAGAGYARNVTGAGYSGYGNVVVVDHGNGVKSLYSHMSSVLVSRSGEWVDTNTVIGLVGSTGDSSTPHLLYEVSSSGSFSAGAGDPGPLQVCHGGQLLAYPQAWGLTTWKGIPWGTESGWSDGTGCSAVPAPPTPVATGLSALPAIRQYLGFLGLLGTKVVYAASLTSPAGGKPVVGAKVLMIGPGSKSCSALTDASGMAVCSVTFALFRAPAGAASFAVAYFGGSLLLPSATIGLIPSMKKT